MRKLITNKHLISIGIWILLLSIFPFLQGNAKDPSFYAGQSKLSTGKWVKLRVQENAIYKLSYEDIQSLGINPSKAKIYGYGGWMLSESFNENDYVDDLPEVPVWMSGSDNKLDPGEFILFYGKGPIKWKYNAYSSEYEHQNNPYSNYGYYFITEGEDGTQVISTAAAETVSSPVKLTTFDDYAVHEQDLIAIISSGRELYGENFASRQSQTFTFNINNISAGNVLARMSFITTATTSTSVSLSINGTNFFTQSITTVGDAPGKETNIQKTQQMDVGSNVLNATVTYSQVGYNAYLNYIRLNMKRYLKPDGGFTLFRDRTTLNNNCNYEISNATNAMFVLELTPGKSIQKVSTAFSDGKMTFNASQYTSNIREFALINPEGSFPKPEIAGAIENQDLHALGQTDMVIITRSLHWEQALRLAQAHIDHDQLKVEVVDANKIYNEFSSGTPDATAYRRFMKMFYDRAGSDNTKKPRYLLLFGDGSHDNRRQTDRWKQLSYDGYLLTYQSEKSLSKSSDSYVTDDYYGYLDDNTTMPSGNLRLGIGRFPAKNTKEAKAVVDKVIAYMEDKTPGNWKNNLIFVGGDDDDPAQKATHISQADAIAQTLENSRPEYLINKIYYAAFKEVKSMGYSTFPDARLKLFNKLKNGAFFLDYVGHGASTKIARDVMTLSDVNLMTYTNLPVWVTATCDLGRFDDIPNSLSEALFLHPTSGGIALITASRTVSSISNHLLNKQIVFYMFDKENGEWPRLGDIVRKGKNAASSTNTLSFALLGDPALRLAYPKAGVRIDSINGTEAGPDLIQLKSKETVTLKGSVLNATGEVDTGFSGKVNVTVMDCPQNLSSLEMLGDSYFQFSEYLNTLSITTGKVTNGEFTATFIVPKEISHSEKAGKILLYALNESKDSDANGYFCRFYAKGVSEDGINTDKGPTIHSIYLNDSILFARSPKVNERPYFVANISDSLGISRSGLGIGHDIMLIIDNKPAYTYPLNEYFISDKEDPGKGTIRFSIPDSLSPGDHSLTFRVWNIMNISSTQTVPFTVQARKAPTILDLYATPNPAKTEVLFYIKHDRPEALVTMKVSVFDLTGRPVWEHEETGYTDALSQTPIYWNLVSSAGERVRPGVYLYRVSMSSKNSKESSTARKLVILAQ